uniref:Unconventional myosin-IXb n=1 Tax=Oncorhynchus tshawytscha TaxID=74940 RepID=A0A8C8HBY7_ONCTS
MSVKDGECGAPSQDGRAYNLQVYPRLSADCPSCCTLKVPKEATAASVTQDAALALGLDPKRLYVLAEVKECGGEEWVLESWDLPVQRVLLWPRKAQEHHLQSEGFYFLLQERNHDGTIHYVHLPALCKEQEAQKLAARGFLPPRHDDFDDLCNLPSLNESSILDNLRNRFHKKKIYTYAGSILIAINPFKFLSIYNPKYVKMYENHQLGKLEPHIFAIADVAYYAMLRKRVNQCIVISGESGSGKTQSTNFLIHCLTALSQKGYASGVERTILGAGPVLEAFGNAKTAHNNNSSLLAAGPHCVNYHVFYYLLVGASEEERKEFKLLQPEDYLYLKQQYFKIEDEEDLCHDFERLQQAMEMVGFLSATKKQIFSVLSAILYLGNVTYRRKSTGRDEGLDVGPPEVLATLSDLLKVKEELLVEALTKRKTVTVNDKLILPYSHSEAITARDSMAKSLYSALFDWIVLRINHALLNKKDMEESVPCLSIGVLDIFGFEDFETNSFEQFCINYANEQLQYYFNQHIFKLEQEEYQAEGITWHNIDYTDNVGCIHLISKKPTGLLYLLDEESNFPRATDETLLAKFKQQHQGKKYFVPTPVMEPAFVIRHFAGKVKYQIKDFREKNTDHMRPDIVALLRSSDRAYVRQLIGMDPVAMFRWGILRATIRGMASFNEAGRRWAAKNAGVQRPTSRTPLGELQRSNTPCPLEAIKDIFTSYFLDMHAQIISSIKDLQLDGEDPRKLLQSWGRLRPFSLSLLDSRSLKFIVGRTLHDRTAKSLLHLNKKKKTPSISAQFQTSLTKLLETLGRAEPFFIRCIRSNSEKKEMCLNETLVLQQLHYTGMLETVRIRRSGYGAKYTFQEFIEQFRVLLPKNATASKPENISALFQRMALDHTTYQIGKTKVYLKELERQQLQDTLHKDVMRKIIFLQYWFRARLERRYFLEMRQAAILIQHAWRRRRTEQQCQAATLIQAVWKGSRQRSEYLRRHTSILKIQALARGHSARRRYSKEDEEARKKEEEARKRAEEEAARQAEEAARLAREAEVEAARLEMEAEEEAFRRKKEAVREAVEWRAREEVRLRQAERVNKEPEAQLTAERTLDESQHEDKVPVQNKEKQREEAEAVEAVATSPPEEVEMGDASTVFQPDEGNGTQAEAGPQLEDESQAVEDPEEAHSVEEEGTKEEAAPQSPAKDNGSQAAAEAHRSQVSRSQEKREQRRQRGMEHSQRESERVALAATKEEPVPKIKGQEAASRAEVKPKERAERADSKELDQYTFVAWKKEAKATSHTPAPIRPSTLRLNPPEPMDDRNGHNEVLGPGNLVRYSQQGTMKEKAEKWKGKKTDGRQPEGSSPDDHSKDRRKKHSLYDIPYPCDIYSNINELYFMKRRTHDTSGHQDTVQSLPPTPERSSGFLRKILKKRSHKEAHTPDDGDLSDRGEALPLSQTSRSHPDPASRGRAVSQNPTIKISRATHVSEQWNASLEREITNANELRHLDEFLGNQVNDFRSRGKPLSATENIFITATMQFRETIKGMYSLPTHHIGYKGLMRGYQKRVISLAGEKQKGEVQLVVNLFQSVLDGFIRGEIKKEEAEPAKPAKVRKKRRKKYKNMENPLDHVFSTYQVNIMQSCDQCNSYIGGMEKVYMCSYCKMVCHKKCLCKIVTDCCTFCAKKSDKESGGLHFGVRLCHLTSEDNPIPIVLEMMLEHVEMNGLLTEGIYRKSGSANRMKELHQLMETGEVCLENYPIHTVTGLIKQWLRKLPDPLMTFTHYNDFLRAVELPEKQEQLHAIYKVLEQLPTACFNTLERLFFHLVKVSKDESHNRMSPNSLAIVFAPCILRCPDSADPLMSMKDVAKTTTCVEILINEQIRRYNEKLEEIEQLEHAEALAVNQLKLKRQNTLHWHLPLRVSAPYKGVVVHEKKCSNLTVVPENDEPLDSDTEAEKNLMERIKSIKQEKEDLACRLPELEQPGSDQDNLDSEASLSSESLLGERCNNSDGCTTDPRLESLKAKPNCPPKPSDLAQRPMSPRGCSSSPNLISDVAFGSTSRLQLPRRHPIIPDTVKLPPGIHSHPPTVDLTPPANGVFSLVKRREQPARRKDSIQSLYISPDKDLFPSPPSISSLPLSTSTPQSLQTASKALRRFSDPDVPYVDEA